MHDIRVISDTLLEFTDDPLSKMGPRGWRWYVQKRRKKREALEELGKLNKLYRVVKRKVDEDEANYWLEKEETKEKESKGACVEEKDTES